MSSRTTSSRKTAAEALIQQLAELDYLHFCPSWPDKCGGCEFNSEAIKLVEAAFEAVNKHDQHPPEVEIP